MIESYSRNVGADGLRGFGALVVVICHFMSAFVPSLLHGYYPTEFQTPNSPSLLFNVFKAPGLNLAYNGHLAVIIFFVLSGYVLSEPYFRGDEAAIQRRLLGRYLRLNIPVAVACFISFFFLANGLYFAGAAAQATGNPWLGGYFNYSLSLVDAVKLAAYKSIVFGDNILDAPVWTLGIEFIASLSLLAFLSFRNHTHRVFVLLFTCGLIYLCTTQSQTLSRLTGGVVFLYVGALFHLAPKANKTVLGILFCVGAYLGGFEVDSRYFGFLPQGGHLDKNVFHSVGGILFSFAVIAGFAQGMFTSKIAHFLGRISYSLYITHFIVLCSAASFLVARWGDGAVSLTAIFLVYLLISFCLALVFANTVDKWAMNLSRRFGAAAQKWLRTAWAKPAPT